MTLAMAAVGDLVSPRERGRYQGYIRPTFAVATVLGPLLGGVLVDHATLALGLLRQPADRRRRARSRCAARCPRRRVETPGARLDLAGAALLAGATGALMLACIWGGEPLRVGLGRDRRARSPPPSRCRRARVARAPRGGPDRAARPARARRAVAVASAALFLATAALFAVTVFVPLFLQVDDRRHARPRPGLLLVPVMVGITLSTILSGRAIARTGRYKRFPLARAGLMAAGARAAGGASPAALARRRPASRCVVFGLGFGMVAQVLIVAVQNSVDRRQLGIATAATSFFRALGGAVGAAVLGAVFAARRHGPAAARADRRDARPSPTRAGRVPGRGAAGRARRCWSCCACRRSRSGRARG